MSALEKRLVALEAVLGPSGEEAAEMTRAVDADFASFLCDPWHTRTAHVGVAAADAHFQARMTEMFATVAENEARGGLRSLQWHIGENNKRYLAGIHGQPTSGRRAA